MTGPRLIHLTTTDISLDWLLRPQLEAFGDAGYEVVAMSAAGAHVPALEAAGIRHVALDSFTRAVDPWADLRAVRELGRALRREAPTILHTHNPKPGVLGRLIGHRVGVPVVVNTVHGLYTQPDDPIRRRLPVYAAEAAAMRFSDAELVQNIEDVPILRTLGPRSALIRHLGNGIDLSRFRSVRGTRANGLRLRAQLGISSEAVVVGMVGRLVAEKGYRELFAAAELVRERLGSTTEFVVIGPREHDKAGAIDDDAIETARARGVHVLDPRPDLQNVYPAFDLFTLPSYREGFPRAAMEASAMGLPVIASDIRGCRQVVEDGVTGRLVPVRDVRALADAITELASSPVVRSAMGRAAVRRAARHFDQRDVIETTLTVYERLLQERNLAGPQPARPSTVRYVDSISLVESAESNEPEVSSAA